MSNDSAGSGGEQDDVYEIVLNPGDGYDKEHAELLRKQLIKDGFHDHVVSVRAPRMGVRNGGGGEDGS